jgi:imidazolonepropionase-like amidohydrolase
MPDISELDWREGCQRSTVAQLTKFTPRYSPAEILKMATADNAELLALSGPRNPYPATLGVIEQGALADLLVT